MNKIFLPAVFLITSSVFLTGCDSSEPEQPKNIKQISQTTYSGEWPFTSDTVEIECYKGGAFVKDVETGNVYGLTGFANNLGTNGKTKSTNINDADFWKQNPDIPGTKISLAPFISDALALCDK
ncbi:TPA: DUF2511 domain-containing protein [Morganella morganii]